MSGPARKDEPPDSLRLANLAGVGFILVGNVVVGLLIGIVLAKYLHWTIAIPIFLMLGFVAGFVAMYRQLTR